MKHLKLFEFFEDDPFGDLLDASGDREDIPIHKISKSYYIADTERFQEMVKKYNLEIVSTKLQQAKGTVAFILNVHGDKNQYFLYPTGYIRKGFGRLMVIDYVGPILNVEQQNKMLDKLEKVLDAQVKKSTKQHTFQSNLDLLKDQIYDALPEIKNYIENSSCENGLGEIEIDRNPYNSLLEIYIHSSIGKDVPTLGAGTGTYRKYPDNDIKIYVSFKIANAKDNVVTIKYGSDSISANKTISVDNFAKDFIEEILDPIFVNVAAGFIELKNPELISRFREFMANQERGWLRHNYVNAAKNMPEIPNVDLRFVNLALRIAMIYKYR